VTDTAIYAAKKIVAGGLLFLLVFYFVCPVPANQLRSFDEIFPGLDGSQKSGIFGGEGFKRSFKRNETQSLIPNPGSGIDLFSIVKEKQPSHFIEALVVVPNNGTPFDLRDAYNAVGRIGDIKNQLNFNRKRNTSIPVYEESTRIEGAKTSRAIPDPPPSETYPVSEEIFLRLKDRYFGNLYVRGELSTNHQGLTFNLTNFKTIRYFLFPVMKAEKFCAILYLEPLEEGMLVYGMAAVDVPDFVASRINIASSVERRLNVFINWIKEGLKAAK